MRFFTGQKPFVSPQEDPKRTLCSLLTLDRLCIVSDSMPKTSRTVSGSLVSGTRK